MFLLDIALTAVVLGHLTSLLSHHHYLYQKFETDVHYFETCGEEDANANHLALSIKRSGFSPAAQLRCFFHCLVPGPESSVHCAI